MVNEVNPFIEHLERHLGPIHNGATLCEGVLGAQFQACPFAESTTFVSVGLSHHVFQQGNSAPARIEFLVACHKHFVSALNPLSIIAGLCEQAISLHRVPPRGTVVGPCGKFFETTKMEALYCASPVYFADALSPFVGLQEPVIIIWLVPITPDEAMYIESHGWSAFEDRLEEINPDLLDLKRASVVAPNYAIKGTSV